VLQLPHTEEHECKKCGTRDAVFFQSQQRTRETGMVRITLSPSHLTLSCADYYISQALFFVCVECGHVWSTLDEK